jgi:hypothetical protein
MIQAFNGNRPTWPEFYNLPNVSNRGTNKFDTQMTKTASQKARAKQAQNQNQRAPQKGKGKKKRWEFNLIKTGNIAASYTSGNISRSTGMSSKSATAVRAAAQQPGEKSAVQIQDEFVMLINGATSYNAGSVTIQPGLDGSFPWLSKIAKLYERYEVLEIEYYYKPTVSPYAAGGQTGKVILACDFDAISSPPETVQQAETTDPHVDGMPYEAIRLRLDPARCTPHGGKFVRTRMIAGADAKTYDSGNLYVCVAGTADTGLIGELRVQYSIRLINPRISEVAVAPCNCASQFYLADNTQVSALADFVSGWSVDVNPLGIVEAGGIFTLEAGTYVVHFHGNMGTVAGLLQRAGIAGKYYPSGGTIAGAQSVTDIGSVAAPYLSVGFTIIIHAPGPVSLYLSAAVSSPTPANVRCVYTGVLSFQMI